MNVYGYEKWVVDTLYISSLLLSLLPFFSLPLLSVPMFLLMAYFVLWPWIHLDENPNAFQWYNWLATPLLR